MFKSNSFISAIASALLLTASFNGTAAAQVQSWTAGQEQTDFGDPSNWNQTVPEFDSIAAIGPHANAENSDVFLDQNRSVGSMLLTDGMVLRTNQKELFVFDLNGGGLTIAGENVLPDNSTRRSKMVVTPSDAEPTQLDLDLSVNGNLRLLDGAELELTGDTRVGIGTGNDQMLDIGTGSLVSGSGLIFLFNASQQSINNSGTIQSGSFGHLHLAGFGFADYDGESETGVLDASAFASRITLDISDNESFDGGVLIGTGSAVEFDELDGWDFGTANVEFNSTNADLVSRFEIIGDSSVDGTTLRANGHGLISDLHDEGANITGTANIEVGDDASLSFENVSASLAGTWTVEENAVLDFGDSLTSADSVAAVLNGGTIIGDGSGTFNNTDQDGIRGYGHFELPLSNSTGIIADGGELAIVNIAFNQDDTNDWDGVNETGQLTAESGDLRLAGVLDSTTQGDVRVGDGRTLHLDGFRMQFDGYVRLNGATVVSEDAQTFAGSVDVTRLSTIDSFVAFEDDVVVDMQADLRLVGHEAVVMNSTQMSGPGDLINESGNRLAIDDGSSLDVDVINRGILANENVENPGVVSLGGNLQNYGTIVFALGGTQAGELTHFDVASEVLVDGGVFQAFFVNDYNSKPGDEFDILNFSSFQSTGHTFDLPELCAGLEWDTSDFESEGVLRIGGILLGDVNLDGVVDLLDVAPFVQLISESQYQPEADINQDGVVNLLDVAPFVELIGQFC